MKKKFLFILMCMVLTVGTVLGISCNAQDADNFMLSMQIGNPIMTVNGSEAEIDAGRGTAPVVQNDRTLVPIRAIIEAMGGTVEWSQETQIATLNYGEDTVRLVIDSNTAYLNDAPNTLDAAPVIINGRTMLPIRFIAESFGFDVAWDSAESKITISKGATENTEDEPTMMQQDNNSSSKILVAYFDYSENISEPDVDAVTSASLNSPTQNASGNIQVIANEIKEKTGADIISIKVSEPYHFNYDVMRERVYKENDDNINPELSTKIDNLEDYDTVFLGTPVWAGQLPPPMRTFIAENDLSGKTIIPFGIHLGSGWGSNINELKTAYPNSTFIEGLTINASTENNTTKTQVDAWLEELGY